MTKSGFKRLGSGATSHGTALMGIYAAGEIGKTRLSASVCRALPEWFGPRAIYVAIDPEAAEMGSILLQDRPNMEVLALDESKDVFAQLKEIYTTNWVAEGFKTIITDTMSVATKTMLSQVANSGRFSDKQIQLGEGVKQPMQGDFLAVQTLLLSLLRFQQQSGMNHLTLFHETEIRPEPGQPGEPIGGPDTVGKANVRLIVNWYNTLLHLSRRQKRRTDLSKPVEYERVCHTTGHGIWQAKLRTPDLTNQIPEIIMESDPANVWRTLDATIHAKETTK